MERTYYRDQVLETIARKVLCAYDTILFYGDPQPIHVEEIIESYGISLEYQYLRKNGRILGKTIFDDGLEAVYDQEQGMSKRERFLLTHPSARMRRLLAGCALPVLMSWPTGSFTRNSIRGLEKVRL